MMSKRLPVYILAGVLVIAMALGIYWYQQDLERIPPGFVFASGRLEADTVSVATKVSGRLEKILFKEGDQVDEGRLLAVISSSELEARVEAAQATVAEAKARLGQVESLIRGARADFLQSKRDVARYTVLYKKQLIPETKLEKATLAMDQAESRLSALLQEKKALQASLNRAFSMLKEARALYEDTRIHAPSKGVILRKVANLGEVLSPGSSIALMVDLDSLYLKAYVPERQVGQITLGQMARIYIDAFPDRSFPGRVSYIAKRAEFTPKEVQTRQARVKQVYAVKIYLEENPEHLLTPGLPADALIRLDQKASWPEGAPGNRQFTLSSWKELLSRIFSSQ